MPGKRSAIYGSKTVGPVTTPAVVEMPTLSALSGKASYPPERLDEVVETLVRTAEDSGMLLLEYTPLLRTLLAKMQNELAGVLRGMPPPPPEGETTGTIPPGFKQVVQLAGEVSVILERVNKMTANIVKAKDDATRLQVFLKEGESGSEGLENLSETQLRKMVAEAASGWMKTE